MKLKVYNTQYDHKEVYFFTVDEFHYYEGVETTVKWAKPHELAIRTNDSVGLRIIQRKNIREIDGKPYEYIEGGVRQAIERIIAGSRGAEYHVRVGGEGSSCTCPGFTFRGKCKHVDTLEQELNHA
jgi:hypothetical protein